MSSNTWNECQRRAGGIRQHHNSANRSSSHTTRVTLPSHTPQVLPASVSELLTTEPHIAGIPSQRVRAPHQRQHTSRDITTTAASACSKQERAPETRARRLAAARPEHYRGVPQPSAQRAAREAGQTPRRSPRHRAAPLRSVLWRSLAAGLRSQHTTEQPPGPDQQPLARPSSWEHTPAHANGHSDFVSHRRLRSARTSPAELQ